MIFISKLGLMVIADLVFIALGYNVYVIDDVVTFANKNQDLNSTDMDEAHHLEAGEVAEERFRYEKSQLLGLDDPIERCYEDLNRCLLGSVSNLRPVCAYNRLWQKDLNNCYNSENLPMLSLISGVKSYQSECYMRSFLSYCDVYFDNCRRGYRYWRILDGGRCVFGRYKSHGGTTHWQHDSKDLFTVENT